MIANERRARVGGGREEEVERIGSTKKVSVLAVQLALLGKVLLHVGMPCARMSSIDAFGRSILMLFIVTTTTTVLIIFLHDIGLPLALGA